MINITKHTTEVRLGDSDVYIMILDDKLCIQSTTGEKQVILDFVSEKNLSNMLDLLHFIHNEHYTK